MQTGAGMWWCAVTKAGGHAVAVCTGCVYGRGELLVLRRVPVDLRIQTGAGMRWCAVTKGGGGWRLRMVPRSVAQLDRHGSLQRVLAPSLSPTVLYKRSWTGGRCALVLPIVALRQLFLRYLSAPQFKFLHGPTFYCPSLSTPSEYRRRRRAYIARRMAIHSDSTRTRGCYACHIVRPFCLHDRLVYLTMSRIIRVLVRLCGDA
ncbi:hypothetical protein C8R45DRAFT_1000054 [Mycena sanguinolenta]|nr:hypothetical protein C8R45DRAFT_1000054 [Mycena sanguinolenta]